MPTTPVETQASQQLPRKHSHRLIAGTPRAAKSESEATVGALRGARRGPTASTHPTNQLTAPPVGGRRLDPDRLGGPHRPPLPGGTGADGVARGRRGLGPPPPRATRRQCPTAEGWRDGPRRKVCGSLGVKPTRRCAGRELPGRLHSAPLNRGERGPSTG